MSAAQSDWRTILYYTSKILFGFALIMLVPALVALFEGQMYCLVIFAFGAGITGIVAATFALVARRPATPLEWRHGLAIVAFSWIIATLCGAIPEALSGYYTSYLDAVFCVMSGLTTTGLTLVLHPDRLPDALNTWRMLLQFVGGQGIVVLALVFFVNEIGAFKIYAGEAKDERLLPNVSSTARAIWRISLVYFVVASAVLFIILWQGGLPVGRSALNGVWMFMSAWSTGGFAPHSSSTLYFHNMTFDYVVMAIALIGSLNFAFHHALWRGKWREMKRNMEFLTFLFTLNFVWVITAFGLMKVHAYPGVISLMHMGFLDFISAHTTTGFMYLYAPQFGAEWGTIAMIGLSVAMLLGGSASSTAGGFKALRIGILWKALVMDIRRMLLPETAVVKARFHHITDVLLSDERVRSSALIIILYLLTFAIATTVLLFYGYPLEGSIFEAASATANAGLSSGITSSSMPWVIKLLFTLVMWMGRLEFLSIFVFASYVTKGVLRR